MPLVWLVLLLVTYAAVEAVALYKIFPDSDRVMLFIAFMMGNGIAFLSVIFNGIFLPLPLTDDSIWLFMIMIYIGFVICSSFMFKITLNKSHLGIIGNVTISALLNLVLMLVFGAPMFYIALQTSNMLFK